MSDSVLDLFAEDYDVLDRGDGMTSYADDIEGYYRDLEQMYFEEELDALEAAEAAGYAPEGYWSEVYSEDDPEAYDDFAVLAEALREVVHPDYGDSPHEEMEEALFSILESMTPAEGLNFATVLGQATKFGQQVLKDPTVGKVARTVLPVAGTAIGGIYGPAGAAIGGQLGRVAGSAFTGGAKPAQPPARAKAAQGSPQGGSGAAAQLLQLTQNPAVLQSLLSLALGSHGKQTVPAGQSGPDVKAGAYANLLKMLTTQLAADADELQRVGDEASAYLREGNGDYRADPTIPEARAEALYDVLLRTENERLLTETDSGKPWSSYFPFKKGTKLLVEYETSVWNPDIGHGRVLARTPDYLKASIHIEEWDRFNVPKTDAVLAIEYAQEGAGNRAVVVVNGRKYVDNNVTIRSRGKKRDIAMSIAILGQRVDRITVSREDSDEAKLMFRAGGEKHVLVLTKR